MIFNWFIKNQVWRELVLKLSFHLILWVSFPHILKTFAILNIPLNFLILRIIVSRICISQLNFFFQWWVQFKIILSIVLNVRVVGASVNRCQVSKRFSLAIHIFYLEVIVINSINSVPHILTMLFEAVKRIFILWKVLV